MLMMIGRRRREAITGPPAKVSVISPANGAVNRQLDAYLSWAKPAMARRYDIYFGETTETLELVGTGGQLARVCTPPIPLALDSTYYFRIDAVNDFGTTTGDVCSFSTWAAADIWTDEQTGVPWTGDSGNYIPHDKD